VRLSERRTLIGLLGAGAAVAILIMPAIYFLGLWLAPPRPVPAAVAAPTAIRQALWARADGGPGDEMRPLNPLNFAIHRACRFLAAQQEDPNVRAERRTECLRQLPAIQGVDYLSGVHLQDEKVPEGGLRYGLSQFATAAWVTRSWTKAEFLDTLAERGDFGFGWRGVDAAANGYFARTAGELALPQAALVASFIGDRGTDPWCDPDGAREMRRRILERMRDSKAITDGELRDADEGALGLAPPPEGHPPCTE
jgi:hypothetical protein